MKKFMHVHIIKTTYFLIFYFFKDNLLFKKEYRMNELEKPIQSLKSNGIFKDAVVFIYRLFSLLISSKMMKYGLFKFYLADTNTQIMTSTNNKNRN